MIEKARFVTCKCGKLNLLDGLSVAAKCVCGRPIFVTVSASRRYDMEKDK